MGKIKYKNFICTCIMYFIYILWYILFKETINLIASEIKKGRQFQYLLSRLSTIIYCNCLQITVHTDY